MDSLVAAAIASGAPIDITSQPALWGGKMRGTAATLLAMGTTEYEYAVDESHSCDLVQAHLIEILSSIGRETIDIYYFRVRQMAEEFQISGALQALELAKQEGHVGHIGLFCDGPSFGTLGAWQFHDAFETLLVPKSREDSESYDTLSPLAKERRVGIVTTYGDYPINPNLIAELSEAHPVLVKVSSPEEIELAINCRANIPVVAP